MSRSRAVALVPDPSDVLAPTPERVDTRLDTNTIIRTANEEHDAAMVAAGSTVQHMIRAGEALVIAKERVDGPWQKWLEDNYHGHFTNAFMCMRFARNARAIEAEGVTTGSDALIVARRIEAEAKASETERAPEAKRLRKEGLTVPEVARTMGLNPRTVTKLTTQGGYTYDTTRQKAARAALRKVEREAEIKAARKMISGRGKSLSDVYGLVRQLQQVVDRVQEPGKEPVVLEVQQKLYDLEDLIGDALRRR
jgi:DNA-binding CsgD family transcriptional regulator